MTLSTRSFSLRTCLAASALATSARLGLTLATLAGCHGRETLTPHRRRELDDRNARARAEAEAAFVARGLRPVTGVAVDVALPAGIVEHCDPPSSTVNLTIATALAEVRWEELCPALVGSAEQFEARLDGSSRRFAIVSPDLQLASTVAGTLVGYRLVPATAKVHQYFAKGVACCCSMAPDGPEARLRSLRSIRVIAAERRPSKIEVVSYPVHLAEECDPRAPQ